ncbi:hypothetical protein RD110_04355 [Rhodoferax koreense]|uniref:GtrA/DPMS transmembrane domain-containing protein n=1 Tax=Rhodoferax koreensis TaxID=1842727 RepID=A0A1P8JS01_9BURK|nr:GtrA family protein [Rhodoferax koreense]APW36532.1 hypothetical protein RD110_04355 [Rhodoferax koreense]
MQTPSPERLAGLGRVLRFGLAGGANTAVTFLVYAGLVRSGVAYPLANGFAWMLGLICGYLLGKLYVFRDRAVPVHRSRKQFLTFTGVYIVSFLLSTGLLAALVESGLFNAVTAQFLVIPVVATFNFVSSRYIVFDSDVT